MSLHRCSFDQIFSYHNLNESRELLVSVEHQKHSVYFSCPNNPHRTHLVLGRKQSKAKRHYGIVTCHDYQTIEAIKYRLAISPTFTTTLLLNGCLKATTQPKTRVIEPFSLIVLLDARNYISRSVVINMSWCRRIWSLAARAHMIAVTGVYYSVLGGAYCSLGKANSKYAYKAGALALEQIKLAKRLKDPVLECKCWLYYAEDLIQLQELRQAQTVIERQKAFVRQTADPTLCSMLEAVESKMESAIIYREKNRQS